LDEARTLLHKGEYLDAAARFREAVRDYPDWIDARLELGDALAALGDMDGALEEYRRVLHRDPQATVAHLKIAMLLMAKRHWKEAQVALNTAVAQQPSHPQAHYALGLVRYSLGDTAGAIEAFRRVIELKPDSADAHYQLGLLLKLTKRTRDAAIEFATAAAAGHPRAQYFIGAAYASGSGIDKQMATAVQWWMVAEDQGVQEAHDALARLRRAVYKWPDSPEGIKAAQAFAAYREALWKEFPSITRSDSEDSLGGHLLALNHIGEAIPVLIREASAMDTLAGSQLALIYEKGADPIVPPFDSRVLRYFESAAADGVPQAKLTLARIRALGLGVPADKQSALNLLKGLHGIKAEQLLTDWSAATNGAVPLPSADQARQSGMVP
jgi:tetratricopeptide (TPR) repeat protein